MASFKLIGLAALVVLLLIVVFQNTQDTTVRFLFLSGSIPLALMLAIVLAGGFVCGLGTAIVVRFKGRGSRTGSP